MLSIDLIRENLTRSEEIVLSRIEEMREHCVVFPTPRGGCHTLWILGHLAYIECLVIRVFMLGEANPLGDWEELFDTVEISGTNSTIRLLTGFWRNAEAYVPGRSRCLILSVRAISTR